MTSESDLQNFIADNPWLLNSNYEPVAKLPNGGKEYQIGSQKRIDLILKDKIHMMPVVVEFKFVPFYRENIGQIIEYKARIAMSLRKEDELLKDIFGDYLLAPKLVLVVRECDSYSRIACNLSGIDVYEFKDISKHFTDPDHVKRIQDFTKALRDDPLPLSLDRGNLIEERVYVPIKTVLEKKQQIQGWCEPGNRSGYFYPQYCNMFVNRWLFPEEIISIGVYEDICTDEKIRISFYSNSRVALESFRDQYMNKYPEDSVSFDWEERFSEGKVERKFEKNIFLDNVSNVFEKELDRYNEIVKSLPKEER